MTIRGINNNKKLQKSLELSNNNSLFDELDQGGALSRWAEYSSPFRLSPEDIKNYLLIFNQISIKEKVLLLGSTPEIRDVLFKLNIDVVVCKEEVKNNEKWTKANWMDLTGFLKESHFDLIIGDFVLCNFEPNEQAEFLKRISLLLKETGFFVTRVCLFDKNIINKKNDSQILTQRTVEEIDELLSKYFIVRDLKMAADYSDFELYPIYILKKSHL